MDERAVNRIGAGSGIASVVLELTGLFTGVAGGRSTVIPGSAIETYGRAFADPVGLTFWLGAYLKLVSFGLFLVFAGWVASVVRRGGEQHAAAAAVATYVATWIAAATFLAGVGAGVLARSPWIGRTALGLSIVLLVAVGAAASELAQLPMLLFLAWILAASVRLGRGLGAGVARGAPVHA